jgi:hypothetical protein
MKTDQSGRRQLEAADKRAPVIELAGEGYHNCTSPRSTGPSRLLKKMTSSDEDSCPA